MITENWLTLLGILGSAVVGYFVKYFFDKKAQFSSQNAEIKRQMYQEYVNFIIDFFDKSKPEKKAGKSVNEMYAFYRKCVLYASPKVIEAYADSMQYFYKNEREDTNLDGYKAMIYLARVFKQMRKDIGLSNRGLGDDGEKVFRAILTDYDMIIKARSLEIVNGTKTGDATQSEKPLYEQPKTKKRIKKKKRK